MKKFTFTAIAGSALATIAIGLAAPAIAAPSAVDDNHQTTVSSTQTAYPMGGHGGVGPFVSMLFPGPYRLPKMGFTSTSVWTNTC